VLRFAQVTRSEDHSTIGCLWRDDEGVDSVSLIAAHA